MLKSFRLLKASLINVQLISPALSWAKLANEYTRRYNSPTAKDRIKSSSIYLRESTDLLLEILDASPFKNRKALRRDKVLEDEAKRAASEALELLSRPRDSLGTYEDKIFLASNELANYCQQVWATTPPFNNEKATTEQRESAILRMTNDDWWLRRLKRMRDQINECMNIAAGIIKKGSQPYCSNVTLQNWKQQRKANQLYLEGMEVVNEETEERFSLAKIAEATTANPEKRRIELMVRCRGLEELADDSGFEAFFVTWTAPSKWHAKSDKWEGAGPKESQAYLCNQWAKCRAKIKRNEIEWFGVRVAEPHADATPHWHMLVFCSANDKNTMINIMEHYALQHDAYEAGAQKHRFNCEHIDRSKGSATGYIAKYISKNINAKHVENEPDFDSNKSLSEAAERVAAWAALWCIRQFQFFGASPVTIWRECRKMKDSAEFEALEEVRKAADSGKWAAFTNELKKNPLSLAYESERRNQFNEIVKQVVGLVCLEGGQRTRTETFRLERKREEQKSDSFLPWSTVNNCTDPNVISLSPQFSFRDSTEKIPIL